MSKKTKLVKFPKEICITREHDERDGSNFFIVRDTEGEGLEVGEERDVAIYVLQDVKKVIATCHSFTPA